MVNKCETCIDLDRRMKTTTDDAEWNRLYELIEQHKAEVHVLKEHDDGD